MLHRNAQCHDAQHTGRSSHNAPASQNRSTETTSSALQQKCSALNPKHLREMAGNHWEGSDDSAATGGGHGHGGADGVGGRAGVQGAQVADLACLACRHGRPTLRKRRKQLKQALKIKDGRKARSECRHMKQQHRKIYCRHFRYDERL